MFPKKLILSFLSISLCIAAGLALAADQVRDQTRLQNPQQDRTQLKEQIFGSQLMTEQERAEHRNKMRSFKTQQEREAYQLEHHKLMQQRAKEKGVTLPDEPMMKPGAGMGPGGGMGGGMGVGRRQ